MWQHRRPGSRRNGIMRLAILQTFPELSSRHPIILTKCLSGSGACRCASVGMNFQVTCGVRLNSLRPSKLTIIGSYNGLSPGRRQAIIWTSDGILLNGPVGTNFYEILVEICVFSVTKTNLKMSSGNWRQFRLGLNVLIIGRIPV